MGEGVGGKGGACTPEAHWHLARSAFSEHLRIVTVCLLRPLDDGDGLVLGGVRLRRLAPLVSLAVRSIGGLGGGVLCRLLTRVIRGSGSSLLRLVLRGDRISILHELVHVDDGLRR